MTKRTQEIIDIVKSMQNNDAALWSQVTHVIFEDLGLSQVGIERALSDDSHKWIEYLQDKRAQVMSGYDLSIAIQNVSAVIDALYKLREYTDDEFEQALEEYND